MCAPNFETLCWSLEDWAWIFPKSWEQELETRNGNSEVSHRLISTFTEKVQAFRLKIQTLDQIFCFRFWMVCNQLGGFFKLGRPLPLEIRDEIVDL